MSGKETFIPSYFFNTVLNNAILRNGYEHQRVFSLSFVAPVQSVEVSCPASVCIGRGDSDQRLCQRTGASGQ